MSDKAAKELAEEVVSFLKSANWQAGNDWNDWERAASLREKAEALLPPGFPVVEVFDGKSPSGKRGRYVQIEDRKWKLYQHGGNWFLENINRAHVTDITPVTSPAPRELMKKVEQYIHADLKYWNAKRPGQNSGAERLLAAVRKHTDPELPAKLREVARKAETGAYTCKWIAEDIRQLADDMEGKR